LTGRVVEFDDDRGFGTIDDESGRRLFFHCTAIADGTRTIAGGTDVEFEVVAGHLGRWEAASVRPRVDSPAGRP
jgi:cold shock CspA family protein